MFPAQDINQVPKGLAHTNNKKSDLHILPMLFKKETLLLHTNNTHNKNIKLILLIFSQLLIPFIEKKKEKVLLIDLAKLKTLTTI